MCHSKGCLQAEESKQGSKLHHGVGPRLLGLGSKLMLTIINSKKENVLIII